MLEKKTFKSKGKGEEDRMEVEDSGESLGREMNEETNLDKNRGILRSP